MVDRWLLLFWGCGVAFAMLAGYALWVKIRVIGLKADLAQIYLETRELADRMGRANDPEYLRIQSRLLGAIRRADMISIPVTFYVFLKTTAHRDELSSSEGVATPIGTEFDSVLIGVRKQVVSRIAAYLTRETACGWMILAMLRAFPTLTQDELEQGAWSFIRPNEELQYA